MRRAGTFLTVITVFTAMLVFAQASNGQATGKQAGVAESKGISLLSLTQEPSSQKACAPKVKEEEEEEYGYKEVSDFFNVREANPSVKKNEWELELNALWQTLSDHTDDDVFVWPSLKYGITNDLFVELEVLPLDLGDGDGQGNGDLSVIVFNRFVRETSSIPAVAGWAEMRIPSGDESAGVDGTFHLNLTKTICPKFRGHLEGWVETANGHRGEEESGSLLYSSTFGAFGSSGADRRHFQWGVGPGFDYQFTDKTIGVLNYLMRSSEEYGHHNSNILEVGMAHKLTQCQSIKLALDIGLDGQEETPNFATKLQWGIEF